ncbi:30S ribosomal protein S6 [Borrelia anserina]|uniref:Small ribosomal subunit protein bS6 n=2 Tax=Borrelia anserina TaxID=143 RepID=W5SMD7_BORAN|nr:30S ribosomal protein S6 [Borrelia anserina]AHH08077.1 SSU ribosomal protein S6P [Borrelia anserina BA2]AHH08916.1 SSU ribosomal protein S6P [Borrelia anserina BA2]APR64623.1 30S ribosomal protein S6 [Borrelia anserina Es]UPA06537.1 30S ribosomal protein S6 [Borrelia anserina]
MIKKYEACFLFKSEELEYKSALEEVKKQLTAFNASDFVENFLGERALEYPIKKQSRGRYEIIEFDMDSNDLKELEVQLKLIKNLLRYMILVKINKKVNVKKVRKRNFREFKDNKDIKEKELTEATVVDSDLSDKN